MSVKEWLKENEDRSSTRTRKRPQDIIENDIAISRSIFHDCVSNVDRYVDALAKCIDNDGSYHELKLRYEKAVASLELMKEKWGHLNYCFTEGDIDSTEDKEKFFSTEDRAMTIFPKALELIEEKQSVQSVRSSVVSKSTSRKSHKSKTSKKSKLYSNSKDYLLTSSSSSSVAVSPTSLSSISWSLGVCIRLSSVITLEWFIPCPALTMYLVAGLTGDASRLMVWLML